MMDYPKPLGVTPMEDDLNAPDPRLPRVAAVIVEHLSHTPGFRRLLSLELSFDEIYSRAIVRADTRAPEELGYSREAEAIQSITRMTRHLREALKGLSPATRYDIELAKHSEFGEKLSKGPHGYTPVLQSVVSELERLEKTLVKYRKRTPRRPMANQKRNWRAASAANIARRVWAAAYWEGGHEDSGDQSQLDYSTHLETFAPRSEQHDKPGPFGRFLEAINAELDILDRNGDPVSAATALGSLKSLRMG